MTCPHGCIWSGDVNQDGRVLVFSVNEGQWVTETIAKCVGQRNTFFQHKPQRFKKFFKEEEEIIL